MPARKSRSASPRRPSKAAPAPQERPDFRLLGKSAGSLPAAPARQTLETFPNRSPHRRYWITFDCAEFTSICPITGQPDFARLRIRYIPDQLCVETKSLKFYLASYRHTPSFNEEVTNRILEDLVAACQPREMIVEGFFSARGGIAVSVEARHPDVS
jgi:7-cyano-7-deazaguanine reductase